MSLVATNFLVPVLSLASYARESLLDQYLSSS